MTLMHSLRSWSQDLTGYFVYLLVTATLGPFLFGYHLSELNAPQDVITCLRKSIRGNAAHIPQCIPMNATQLGLVSSAFTVGGLVGALAAGPAAARYGRLQPMRFNTMFTIVGPICEALAPNIALMVLGRFFSGIGAGAALVVVPLYVSEISPQHGKGFFGAFTQIMTNFGIFTTQLLGWFLSHDSMWRLILAIGGLFALAQLIGLIFATESPQWQADHGKPRAARISLRRIRGQDADITGEMKKWNVSTVDGEDGEQDSLLDNEDPTSNQHGGLDASSNHSKRALGTFEVLKHPHYGPATFAGMMVLSAQQFCGINSIVMYGVSLLSTLLKSNSALLNVFVSLLNMVATAVCAPLIDILGRKTCLLSSIGGMGISSILLAIGIRGAIPVLSTISVLLFVGSFAVGLGPVPFMLSSELVGPEAVGATQSWGLAANWVSTFIIAQFFPLVNEKLPKGTVYFIFAGLDALFFVLVLFLIPETKGKKDADEVWGRKPRAEE